MQSHSGARALAREPGIHNPGLSASVPPVVMDSGLAARQWRPGKMGWTAPDGIIGAKLVVRFAPAKGTVHGEG